jgi:hypothetical protein
MPFRLRRDTRKWFQDIAGDFEVDFDMYYLCLVAGLAAGGRRAETKSQDTTELVDTFPGSYKEKGRVIIALFLATEIERMGISQNDREAVHKQIKELVDPRTPSQLSEEGMRQMNQISYGGFDALTEEFDDRPRSIEVFLTRYCDAILHSCNFVS